MSIDAALLSIGHAVPPHRLLQSDAAAAARRIFAHRYAAFERMAPVFETAGIRTRYTVKPLDWYFSNLDWPERNAAYLAGAQDLFVAAASRALADAGCEARDVDTIVTISSTGIATPSLEARVAGRMGFRSDVERVPVFGLGCAGGVSGLAIADRLARARPGSTVLLVAIEICTAAFRMDQLTSANMVATALFGDGAAACVVRTGETGLARIEGAGEHLWPDSLDIMGWKVPRRAVALRAHAFASRRGSCWRHRRNAASCVAVHGGIGIRGRAAVHSEKPSPMAMGISKTKTMPAIQ
jgi:alkylresorcinol/alkylpyrone synthase